MNMSQMDDEYHEVWEDNTSDFENEEQVSRMKIHPVSNEILNSTITADKESNTSTGKLAGHESPLLLETNHTVENISSQNNKEEPHDKCDIIERPIVPEFAKLTVHYTAKDNKISNMSNDPDLNCQENQYARKAAYRVKKYRCAQEIYVKKLEELNAQDRNLKREVRLSIKPFYKEIGVANRSPRYYLQLSTAKQKTLLNKDTQKNVRWYEAVNRPKRRELNKLITSHDALKTANQHKRELKKKHITQIKKNQSKVATAATAAIRKEVGTYVRGSYILKAQKNNESKVSS